MSSTSSFCLSSGCRLREEINALAQANRKVTTEYDKKLKEDEEKLAETLKDKQNLETQLEAAKEKNKELVEELDLADCAVADLKQKVDVANPAGFDVLARCITTPMIGEGETRGDQGPQPRSAHRQ